MIIKRLTIENLDSVFANRLRALQNTPSAFLITYEEEKAQGPVHFKSTLESLDSEKAIFGALDNNEVVGMIGISKEDRPKISHKAIIWGMYVDVDYRRKGIAAQLVDAALDFAKKEMKVDVVNLSVETENTKARKLYETKGFKVWGSEPKAMKVGNILYGEDHMIFSFT